MITENLMRQLHRWSYGSERRILGIVGLPGAGKSTIADYIKRQLGDRVALVPMDGFHLANNQLQRLGRAQRKGAPDTFDILGYQSLLLRIKSAKTDETIYAPAFHREIESSIAGEIAIEHKVKLIVTEGNYLLSKHHGWQVIAPLLDECWFVEVDEQQRLRQLIARHIYFGRTPEAAQAWVTQTDQVNAQIVRETADLATRHISLEQCEVSL